MLDAHLHVNCLPRDELAEILKSACDKGITAGISAGVWPEDIEEHLQLAGTHPELRFFRKSEFREWPESNGPVSFFGVFLALGLHPMQIPVSWFDEKGNVRKQQMNADLERFEKNLELHKDYIWALGETGFDGSRAALEAGGRPERLDKSSLIEVQETALMKCAELACAYQLPLIIHSRGAWAKTREAIRRIQEMGVPAVMIHCYGGPAGDLQSLAQEGVFVSFGGVPTWKSASKIREAARICPDDIFMFETDSPDLSPEYPDGSRPQLNTPGELELIAESVAALRAVSTTHLKMISDRNIKKFLGCKGRTH